eukprot:3142198-Pleurochrysis_carterae.AAC.2
MAPARGSESENEDGREREEKRGMKTCGEIRRRPTLRALATARIFAICAFLCCVSFLVCISTY